MKVETHNTPLLESIRQGAHSLRKRGSHSTTEDHSSSQDDDAYLHEPDFYSYSKAPSAWRRRVTGLMRMFLGNYCALVKMVILMVVVAVSCVMSAHIASIAIHGFHGYQAQEWEVTPHLSSQEGLHIVDLSSSRTPGILSMKDATEVPSRVMSQCTPVSPSELAVQVIVLEAPPAHASDNSDTRIDEHGEDTEHQVVTISDVMQFNEASIGPDKFAAPKFWADNVKGFNPCICSVETNAGKIIHLINPSITPVEVLNLPDGDYYKMSSPLEITYDSLFTFPGRTSRFYNKAKLNYISWPDLTKVTIELDSEDGDTAYVIQDIISLLEEPEAYHFLFEN